MRAGQQDMEGEPWKENPYEGVSWLNRQNSGTTERGYTESYFYMLRYIQILYEFECFKVKSRNVTAKYEYIFRR